MFLLFRLIDGKKQLVCFNKEPLLISEASYPEPAPINEAELRESIVKSLTMPVNFKIKEGEKVLYALRDEHKSDFYVLRFPIEGEGFSYKIVKMGDYRFHETDITADEERFNKEVEQLFQRKIGEYNAEKTLSFAKSKVSSTVFQREVILLDTVEELHEQLLRQHISKGNN